MSGRVAFFLPSLTGGGAERVIVNLMEGITEREWPVDIVLAAAAGRAPRPAPRQARRLVDLRAGRVMRSLVPAGRLPAPRAAAGAGLLLEPRQSRGPLGREPGPDGHSGVVTVHNTMSQSTRQSGGVGRTRSSRTCCARSIPGLADRGGLSGRGRRPRADVGAAARPDRGGVQPGHHPDGAGRLAGQTPDHPWFGPGAAAGHSRRRAPDQAEGLPDSDPRLRGGAAAAARAPDYSRRGRGSGRAGGSGRRARASWRTWPSRASVDDAHGLHGRARPCSCSPPPGKACRRC